MKRLIFTILITSISLGGLNAAQLQVGVLGGLRSVSNSGFSDVYGSGLAFSPYAAIEFAEGFSIGTGFTLGYSKDKPVGLFNDPSTFSMSSIELFGRYRFESGPLDPYIKAGLGLHFYSQTIAAAGIDFNENALGFMVGAGGEWALTEAFSLIAELGYTLLNVDPLGTEVKLGGFCIQLGAAYTFTL